jgi:collagenase-like PrtC family protease
MKFDLPLKLNVPYLEFLRRNEDLLYSVYFQAPDFVGDARIHVTAINKSDLQAASDLKCRKYMTLNGRTTPLAVYGTLGNNLTQQINALYQEQLLTGILILDFYLLRKLADEGLDRGIDVVPSINMGIDSVAKAHSAVQHIVNMGFSVPSKLILDRSLNRSLKSLAQISRQLRKDFPRTQLELLANEGCIQHCPYKVNHDAAISTVNDRSAHSVIAINQARDAGFDVSRLNEDLGCIRHFETQVEDVLKIPFIRPEDLKLYRDYFDVLKIAGRTKSNDFLFKAVGAYVSGYWEGNLLDILDAAGAMSEKLHVFNDQLPDGFGKMLSGCQSRCFNCTYCGDIAASQIQRLK